MEEQVRRVIAFRAERQISKKQSGAIFSYDSGEYALMSDTYDYHSGSHIGTNSNGVYHYGIRSHISLNITGNNFSGYDYNSGYHFQGTVLGGSVQLYDYHERRYYNYSV